MQDKEYKVFNQLKNTNNPRSKSKKTILDKNFDKEQVAPFNEGDFFITKIAEPKIGTDTERWF